MVIEWLFSYAPVDWRTTAYSGESGCAMAAPFYVVETIDWSLGEVRAYHIDFHQASEWITGITEAKICAILKFKR